MGVLSVTCWASHLPYIPKSPKRFSSFLLLKTLNSLSRNTIVAKRKRCLMIGAGGMARGWIRRFFPCFTERSEIVALVDVDEVALNEQGDFLDLPKEARFTDIRTAFARTEADYCTIVTPPWVHRRCVEAACRHRMPILTEKPIADTWKDVAAIYRAVKRAGVKCTVIQNYRYDATMFTFREVLRSRRLGRLNYIMGRYQADYAPSTKSVKP